jgi:uncharacterized protein (DUF885 family)
MTNSYFQRGIKSLAILVVLLSGCSSDTPPEAGALVTTSADVIASVNEVADAYYAHVMSTNPETAYFSGIELDRHDGLQDNSLAAGAANDAAIDAMLAELRSVHSDALLGDPAWITQAYLLEELEGIVGMRVCRTEVWNVNQMGGWHSGYSQVAQLQPIGTAELREQCESSTRLMVYWPSKLNSHLSTRLPLVMMTRPLLLQHV